MQSGNQSSSVPKIVGGIVAILVCCSCLLMLGAGSVLYRAYQQVPDLATLVPPFEDPVTPRPTPQLERPPAESVTDTTLETLEQTEVPENDPVDLACRLQAVCNVPETVPAKSYQLGDQETFWVLNSDTAEHRQANFTLLYVTPHSYFWAEDGTDVNEGDMRRLMDTFENKIYPTDRKFFGSEALPGVDNDPHVYVLYAHDLGERVAGYFNSSDGFHPQVREFSNAHETYVLSSNQDLGSEYAYSTLAHEFVHMIQANTDRNDSTWITEGFAEVGSFINGYSVGNHDWGYVQNPDVQLTDWEADGSNSPHYGQSFLYLAYFLDRFGEEATQALNNNPENSLRSVDDTLDQLDITDPQTGRLMTADDLFMDWAAALYLRDGSVGDGRYTYNNYPDGPQYIPLEEDIISRCPRSLDTSVNQYGIDFHTIACEGEYTLQFTGSTLAGLLPVEAKSGSHAFWSNKGDESDMTLTREFDFTNVSGPITLTSSMWYDLETDYDYVYLEASTDGETWEILTTPSGTDEDPGGNSYGWAYNGQTNGWVTEAVDLSSFAGQVVQIRFEYITDAAVNGEGFLLDDVRVDAINYQSDFESDDGGWEAAGFVRMDNILPQTYRLSLILKGDTTTVTEIPLSSDQTAEIPLSLNGRDQAILIVTGNTRFTEQPAAYRIEIK